MAEGLAAFLARKLQWVGLVDTTGQEAPFGRQRVVWGVENDVLLNAERIQWLPVTEERQIGGVVLAEDESSPPVLGLELVARRSFDVGDSPYIIAGELSTTVAQVR